MKVKLHHDNKKHEFMTVFMSPDDNGLICSQKLAHLFNCRSDHIYCWFKKPVKDKDTEIFLFLSNLFGQDKNISSQEFVNACFYYFDVQIKDPPKEPVLNHFQALYILKNLDIKNTVHSLFYNYVVGTQIEYFPCNPFVIPKNYSVPPRAVANTLHSLTLESIGVSSNTTLHCIIKSSAFPDWYFPWKQESMSKDFITALQNIESIVQDTDVTDYPSESYITYAIMKCNEINLNPNSVDLAPLFSKVYTLENMPLIKFRSANNIYYKIFKPYLNEIDDQTVTKMKKTKHIHSKPFISFKFKIASASYCTFMLSDKLAYNLRVNTVKRDKITLSAVWNVCKIMNAFIAGVRKIYPHAFLPDITKDNTEFIELDTHNSIIPKKGGIKYEALQSTVENQLYLYFNVISTPEKSVLHLQYKKTDNYMKYETIQAFITRIFHLEKSEIIRELTKQFLITDEQAELEYENWTHKNAAEVIMVDGEKTIIKPKTDHFTTIKLRLNNLNGLTFLLIGLKTPAMMDRIEHLIKVLLALTKKTLPISRKPSNFEEAFEGKIANDFELVAFDALNKNDTKGPVDFFDDELLEFEKTFFESVVRPTPAVVVPAGPGGPSRKAKGPILERLMDHDPQLFSYVTPKGEKRRDFATLCTGRQPIVINKKEKDHIDETYPGSYHDSYLRIGSTPELASRNYYICPSIWCPLSKVSLSYQQYKDLQGCPDPEEKPFKFENQNYWGMGEAGLTRKRYPSVLDPHTHPQGFCLPCCFKLESLNNKTRNKTRTRECKQRNPELIYTPEEDEAVVGPPPPSGLGIGNPKYIMGEDKIPLDVGRYGVLPSAISSVLQPANTCVSGVINPSVSCYLRKSVDDRDQSFMSALVQVLDNPNMKSVKDCQRILGELSVAKFLQLENGKIMKLFIDPLFDIQSNFKSFKTFFLKNEYYVNKFNLVKIKNAVENSTSWSSDAKYAKEILREFLIYNGFYHFQAFIKNRFVDHRALIDLVYVYNKLNPLHYNVIVLSSSPKNGAFIECPFNKDTKDIINVKNPFVFIINHDNKYYEPLHFIKEGTTLTKSVYHFDYQSAPPEIRKIIKYYYNNCRRPNKVEKGPEDVAIFLESRGYMPKYYVMDFDFQVCGVLLANNLYVPFHQKSDTLLKKKLIYLNEVPNFKCSENESTLKKIFKELETFSVFYQIQQFEKDYIVLNQGHIVPLNVESKDIVYRTFRNDLEIFVHKMDDEPIPQDVVTYKKITSSEYRSEIEFLIQPGNPFPINFRRQKLVGILTKIGLNNISKITERLLMTQQLVYPIVSNSFVPKHTEIIVTYHDILNKRLENLIAYQKNPYMLLNERLNDMSGNYSFASLPDSPKPDFITSNMSDVFSRFVRTLTKYGFKKIVEEDYDIGYLYRFFAYVDKYINALTRSPLSVETMKNIIATRIVNDYNSNEIAGFLENASLRFILGAPKIKPALTACLDTFHSMFYYPENYDINILADLIKVNVIVLTRQKAKLNMPVLPDDADGVKLFYVHSEYYVLLERHHVKTKGVKDYHRYDIIVNDSDAVFKIHQLGAFADIVRNKLTSVLAPSSAAASNASLEEPLGMLTFDSNSCYLDCTLMALFHRPNVLWTQKLLNTAHLRKFSTKLAKQADNTAKELLAVYNTIHQQGKTMSCTELRSALHDFDELYYKTYKTATRDDVEWKETQQEPRDVINVLQRLFNITDDVNVEFTGSDGDINKRKLGFADVIVPSAYLKVNEKVRLDDFIPVTFDPETKTKKKYVNASVLWVTFERTYAVDGDLDNQIKLNTQVYPMEKITLEKKKLECVSIIIHHGNSPHIGHYTCLIKHSKEEVWYHYDDMKDTFESVTGGFAAILANKKWLANITSCFYI